MNILYLNEDCIERVFDYLNEKDQLNLAAACEQFRRFFLNRARHYRLYEKVDEANYSATELGTLLGVVGENVRRFQYAKDDASNLDISKYCQHIEEIWLPAEFKKKHLKEIVKFKSLKILRWQQNNAPKDVSNLIGACKRVTSLKLLQLNCGKYYNGKNLNQLKRIESLILANCMNLTPKNVILCCIELINLRILCIMDFMLSEDILRTMIKCCHNLEELSFCERQNGAVYLLADLPKLRRLRIDGDLIPTELFINLAERKSNQLESLSIADRELTVFEAACVGRIHTLKELIFFPSIPTCFDQLTELRCLKYLTVVGEQPIPAKRFLKNISYHKSLRFLNYNFVAFDTKFPCRIVKTLEAQKSLRKYDKLGIYFSAISFSLEDIHKKKLMMNSVVEITEVKFTLFEAFK